MLISEVEPIGEPTSNLLNDDLIDKIIELPLRKACRIFKEKGIETVMSSANKSNILKPGERAIEKEDVYGTIEKLLETHVFMEAGKGYAWIMLNFNTLSLENKEMLFELEQKKDEKGNNIGEKLIWFVHPCEMFDNIEYGLRIGKYNYELLKLCIPEESIPKNIEVDETLIEFEKRHIVLMYPWTDSATEAVFLRMPINSKTTVEEVEQYFVNFTEYFKEQLSNKKSR